ncbi:MAG: phosphatase PAP2 family protein [Variovorax sp.]
MELPRGDDNSPKPSSLTDRYRSLLKSLLIGLAAASLALVFAKLGGEVVEGDTHSFDVYVLRVAQEVRATHPWVADVMRDLSGLGSTTVIVLFTVICLGYLVLVSARATALLVAAAVVSGTVLVSLFKTGFGRLRPDAASAEMVAPGLSFPSGHASISAIVFLTLGALIASSRSLTTERLYILSAAGLMTFLVGISRVALGVHWATDVLGGWALGAAWALAWLLAARRLA